jgi:hypothetical protein
MQKTEVKLTAIDKVALFETDKSQRLQFAEAIIGAMEERVINPLQVHMQIKCMEDVINSLTNTTEKTNKNFALAVKYKELLMAEAEKESGKSFEYLNAKFEKKEVGTKYDYSQCGDLEYADLITQKQALDAKVKERENYLKNIPYEGVQVLNEVTGETYKVFPPSKSSTTSIAVSLK